MGIRSLADRVDAAYIASRAATHEICKKIRPQQKGGQNDRDGHLQNAIESFKSKLPMSETFEDELEKITQNKLNEKINDFEIEK